MPANKSDFHDTDTAAAIVAAVLPRIARWVTLDFFQKQDLPPTQMFTLLALQEKTPCRLGDLRRRLHVSAPTATGLVDRLQQRGLVTRQTDPVDRRAVMITMTPYGKRLAQRFQQRIRWKWGILLQRLSERERSQFVEILMKLQNLLTQ